MTGESAPPPNGVPQPGAVPLLSGVVVHWGDPEPLSELVAAWPEDGRFELVVVDNGGLAGSAVEGDVRQRARVVEPGGNLGFAGGVNAGAAAARAPLLLVLNPDAVPEPEALERLLAAFAAEPGAAAIVPRLVGPDGAPQAAWQLRRLPSAVHLLLQALGLPAAPGARREPAAGEAVEQPAAAALGLRRQTLDAVGGFDERYHPAWFEDVDLAARLAAGGRRLVYRPEVVLRHRLGSTVAQLGYGRFLWTYQRNLVRYLGRHHGPLAVSLARLLLPAGLLVRLLLLPLRRPRRAVSRPAAALGLAAAWWGTATGWRGPAGWAAEAPPVPRPFAPLPGQPVSVAVLIVTRDDVADVLPCLAAVAELQHRPLEVVAVDCASSDGTVAELEREAARLAAAGLPCRVLPRSENLGFAGGMNASLAHTAAPWVLTLNADARPEPDYVSRLLEAAHRHPLLPVGAVTGRLLRFPELRPSGPDGAAAGPVRRLDACGMRLTRTWRHLDRGSGEPDHGQYLLPERVFGGTGAATLWRRAALDDAAVEPGEAFDPRFHSFREDAELAFRLRERGWEVLYEPTAVAEHRRFNLPGRRRAMPPAANFHSLKNRYLLRLYHQTPGNLLRTLVPTLLRDVLALGYVLLRERASLAAYGWLWRHRGEILDRRRAVQERRRVPPAALDRWFGRDAMPLEGALQDPHPAAAPRAPRRAADGTSHGAPP